MIWAFLTVTIAGSAAGLLMCWAYADLVDMSNRLRAHVAHWQAEYESATARAGRLEKQRSRERAGHAALVTAVRRFLEADDAVLVLEPLDDESAYDEVYERHRAAREALTAAVEAGR